MIGTSCSEANRKLSIQYHVEKSSRKEAVCREQTDIQNSEMY